MVASIYGRADRTTELPDGARVSVHSRGGGAYTVAVWTRGGALVGSDESLSLPWQDHDRALRDAVGFLAAYARPEESGAFSDYWTPRMAEWADALEERSAELEGWE